MFRAVGVRSGFSYVSWWYFLSDGFIGFDFIDVVWFDLIVEWFVQSKMF